MLHKKTPTAPAATEQPSALTKAVAARNSQVPVIIAAECVVTGDVCTDGDLQLDGAVIGRVQVDQLVIGATGRVQGEVVARAARISGTLEGKINVKSLSLAPTAIVTGEVFHEVIAIEAGARLDGVCRHVAGGGIETKQSSGSGPTVQGHLAETQYYPQSTTQN